MVSESGVHDHLEHDELLLGLGVFLVWFILAALLIVPPAIVLGAVDAAARRSSRPLVQVLLLVLVALLIVLFALGIVPAQAILLYRAECDNYTCATNTLGWPEYIGVLIGAELGLVMLMVVSVTDPLRGER
jgi:hypothetical protein